MAKNMLTFDKNFITSLDEGSFKRYILEVDVEYSKNIFYLDRDLPFSAEKKKNKKYYRLVPNIHDKDDYVAHIRALKQALNCGLILKKVVIHFNQEAWLKS